MDETRQYEVTLNFLHKINPEKVATKNTARCIEFCIVKAESGPYWTSLTSDKKKPHFLKADFNKWRDEDSDNEEGMFSEYDSFHFLARQSDCNPYFFAEEGAEGGGDFGNMQNMFANLNAAGGKPNFDDFDDVDETQGDSDDEEIPNLE